MYEGFVQDGKKEGVGKEVHYSGVFKGTFKNDERHGRGKSEVMGTEITEYYENGELVTKD